MFFLQMGRQRSRGSTLQGLHTGTSSNPCSTPMTEASHLSQLEGCKPACFARIPRRGFSTIRLHPAFLQPHSCSPPPAPRQRSHLSSSRAFDRAWYSRATPAILQDPTTLPTESQPCPRHGSQPKEQFQGTDVALKE